MIDFNKKYNRRNNKEEIEKIPQNIKISINAIKNNIVDILYIGDHYLQKKLLDDYVENSLRSTKK